ncbi:type IX secretion system membrane protein PorP/SprF [Paracrocinitomix mangrovi]|uniref:PorP/SprF family type IX secretion system membrane protein n=1 Tax=Paracrocinitomix mangrovi TaxID=2862509 RepID=UPI001C8E7557|nr:type IX secretion system membrane protein PorP/SprF [Paracrocinitomix mangrovi]UKN03209.1 type IX secretion system membrane protein PorP/SprF [Paracrocinitomix mangrovi]
MMKLKNITLLGMLMLSTHLSFGQQDALFSQYMFNPFAVNPAYAGSRRSISSVLVHRSQWLGMQGAPNTQTLSVHSKAGATKLAWGVNMAHDVIGPSRNFWGALTAGYHLQLSTGQLSFALRGGVFNSTLDRSKLDFDNQADIYNVSGKESALVPSFDFGAYYYTNRFYAGLSVNHLTKHTFNYDGYPTNTELYLDRHYMLMGGGVFEIKSGFVLKPSVMLRYAEGAPFSFDANISALIKKIWWIGASLRKLNSIVLVTEFNVTDYLRLGYSFDLSLTELRKYNAGSHEFFIGFDFAPKKDNNLSPRYL